MKMSGWSCSLVVLLALLALVHSQDFTDTFFSVPSFSAAADEHFYRGGGASLNPAGYISMTTPATTNIAPVLWYERLVYIRGMSTSFAFSSSKDSGNSGEGVVFVIQAESSDTAGRPGSGLGYSNNSPDSFSGGITNSVAVEIDCIQEADMGDPVVPHVSVHTRDDKENHAHEQWSVGVNSVLPKSLCDGDITLVDIVYENKVMTIWMNFTDDPILEVELDLESRLQLREFGRAYIGFTASTGDFGADQRIWSWDYRFLGVLDAANTYATGDGLVSGIAGEEASFLIFSMDQYNNQFPFGDQDIDVSLQGPGVVDVTVTYVANGTYEARYTVNVTGTYEITILANGVQIGTPANPTSLITSAPAVAHTSENLDPVASLVQASHVQYVKVVLRDQYGNQREVGGDDLAASFQPADPRDNADITDHNDGTYTIAWAAFLAQDGQQLSVTLNGLDIINSPFTFDVVPDDIHPPTCILTDFSLDYEAGVRQTFQLLSRDAHDNAILTGGHEVTVTTVPNEPTTQFEVNDMGTGTYVISGYFQKAQSYELSILVDLEPAAESPYDVVTSPTILSIPNCEAGGTGLSQGLAGVQSQFTIYTKDKYDNPLEGQVTTVFDVELVGPVTLKATTVNNADGTVTARYTPTVSGDFSTSITVSSVHIKNSPAETDISPTVESPETSYIVGNNYTVLNGAYERQTWFQVQVTDIYGNQIRIGGHDVTASFTTMEDDMLPIELNIVDNNNGTYTFTYTPGDSQAGTYTLTIYLSQQNIKDSPFTVSVAAKSNKNAILLGVCLGLVGLCVIGLFGLVMYRRYKRRQHYTQLSSDR